MINNYAIRLRDIHFGMSCEEKDLNDINQINQKVDN